MGNRYEKPIKCEENFNNYSNFMDRFMEQPGYYKVKAICNYTASMKINDISFKKNEIMLVTWRYDDTWLEVIKEKDQKQGLIPSHLVIRIEEGPQSMKGWRDIQRRQAKYLLLNPDLKRGTYILRPSSKKNCYALSIRDYNKKKHEYIVKNFLIKTIQSETGEKYLTHIRIYPNIASLINYFKAHGIGVNHTKLSEPIPNYCQSLPTENNQLNRQTIEFLSQTYVNNFDLKNLEQPEIHLNKEFETKPSRLNMFFVTIKLKFKYQCRKSKDYFLNSRKNRNLKI